MKCPKCEIPLTGCNGPPYCHKCGYVSATQGELPLDGGNLDWNPILKKFDARMRKSLDLWKGFNRYALKALRHCQKTGKKNIGGQAIVEILRWEYWLQTEDDSSDFKIPNEYVAYLTRLWHVIHPQHDGFFTLRDQFNCRTEWQQGQRDKALRDLADLIDQDAKLF